jgi:hypothetical protein
MVMKPAEIHALCRRMPNTSAFLLATEDAPLQTYFGSGCGGSEFVALPAER